MQIQLLGRWPSVLLMSSCFLVPSVAAQKKSVADIEAEFNAKTAAWSKAYGEARKSGDNSAVSKAMKLRPRPTDYADALQKIIDADPKSDAALRAAKWMIERRAVRGPAMDPVLAVLGSYHAQAEGLDRVCQNLGRSPAPAAMRFLRTIEAKNANASTKAHACMSMATALVQQAGMVRSLKNTADKKTTKRMVSFFGKETVDILRSKDPAKIEKEAETRFEKIMKTEAYADVQKYGSTLSKLAKSELFELRNLSIGKVAPEIAGEDIDGNAMNLSDYRGKVVVLDFWGDW